MHYIKPTHDVLGLEKRVKAVLNTVDVNPGKISAVNSVYLTDGTDNWHLYRKPSKSTTQMWVTLKKNFSGEQVVDDTLNAKSLVEVDEILCRVTFSGVADGFECLNVFNQGASAGAWGCYGSSQFKIEAVNAANITSIGFFLKPDGYTDTISKVHTTVFRGVRGQSADTDTPEDGNLILTFPV